MAYPRVLVGEDGSARLNLGVQHVRVVDAHEKLEVRLDSHLCYRVDDGALSEKKAKRKTKKGREGKKGNTREGA